MGARDGVAGAAALESRCNRHGARPVAHHSCGLYAFAERADALAYVRPRAGGAKFFVRRPERARGVVVGVVSGWGRVVRHARGWRSQYAYPYDLYLLNGDRGLARAVADIYAVETSPFPPDPASRSV